MSVITLLRVPWLFELKATYFNENFYRVFVAYNGGEGNKHGVY